jgi:WD40 repeat protein
LTAGNFNSWREIRERAIPAAIRSNLASEPLWVSLRERRAEILANTGHPRLRAHLVEDLKQILLRLHEPRSWEELQGEERTQRRRVLSMMWSATLIFLFLAAVATVFAIKANIQAKLALSRQLVAQAQSLALNSPSSTIQSVPLALESQIVSSASDVAADAILRGDIELLARPKVVVKHADEITAFSVATAGDVAATGEFNGSVLVWNTGNGKVTWTFKHKDSVNSLDISRDGKLLATGSDDKTAAIWSLAEGKQIVNLPNDESVYRVRFSPDGTRVATGTFGGTVAVWDTQSGKQLFAYTFPDDQRLQEITDIKFSKDGRLIFASSEEGHAGVWDWNRSSRLAFAGGGDWILALAISPDESAFATVGNGPSSELYETKGGRQLWDMYNGVDSLSAAFSPDGNFLALGCHDNRVRIWNVKEHRLERILQVNNLAFDLSFDRTGTYLTVLNGTTTSLWNWVNGAEVRRITHGLGVIGAQLLPDGRRLISASADGTARVWEVLGGYELADIYQAEEVDSLAFDPSGRLIAVPGEGSLVHLWNVADGTLSRIVDNEGAEADVVDFDETGKLLAVGSSNGSVKLWNPETGGLVLRLPTTSRKIVEAVRFSPDGRFIAAGGWDDSVHLWRVNGESVWQGPALPNTVTSLAFSPDGGSIAVGCLDGIVRLVSAESGAEVARFTQGDQVWSVAFAPNGKILASASSDGRVQLWNVSTRQPTFKFSNQGSSTIAFSPDGQFLAIASWDRVVHLWRLEDNKEIARIPHSDAVRAVAFSPDGKYIASGGLDRRVILSNIESGSVQTLACTLLMKNVTPEEWLNYSVDLKKSNICPNVP